MTFRTILRALAPALLLAGLSAAAHAGAVEDCRSTAQVTNASLLAACTAVIDGKQASASDTAYAYYRRALVGSANPQADQALIMADVSKAIELDPRLMEAFAFRALGYNRALQHDKAIADLSSAIALAPDRWGLYSLRAMIEAQKKDDKAAIADFKAALARNPPASSADMIRQRISKLEQKSAQ
ncbi:tetratricopeptide repeat protein [Aestuariivirga litoralis]|uniref:tetratricopeptide repeat protein n=1 Tax=Aestuariivirga litoralis TaxID=2650924 RepID=UPI0011B51929|nr:tetratricopeptide repeat protein [Aestuariivirga litoralis]